MSPVLRPRFFEGQLLAASDLGELVDYGRARAERHDRFLHRPGIVTGLALETEEATDANGTNYKRVFVAPGLAIDGLGREIVLDARVELDAQRFNQTLGASADATSFFPVLMRSQFVSQAPGARSLGACESTQGTRIEERIDVFVGRAGDERTIDGENAAPSPRASAGEGAGPLLLLGFVQWNPTASQFAAITNTANGVSRRYVGVNAATIAGMGDRVVVQLKPAAVAGDLALELDGAAGTLRFGPLQASGAIDQPLLSVDRDGNLQAKGVLSGRSTSGAMLLHSGTASDGLILPLPPGVTDEQVSAGDVSVHVLVSPHIDPSHAPPSAVYTAALVEECRVDDERRLHCRIGWMTIGAAVEVVSAPGAADFIVFASTKAGGSS